MEKYLNSTIKEVISDFPEVGDILNEHNIGCVPCNVGNCLLKDIVEIHNLSPPEEQELLARIARVIYPDSSQKISKIKRKPQAKDKEIRYSPPIRRLVDEHALIKRLIALIPKIISGLDVESEEDRQLILNCADFIRSYADRYHHAKEEEILFKYFDEDLDIIKTMLKDHETARNHVKSIIEAVEKQNKITIAEHLNGYKELLTEHIKKEDEILYPWIERNLSITHVGELFTKFNAADKKIGEAVPRRNKKFIMELEKKLQKINNYVDLETITQKEY